MSMTDPIGDMLTRLRNGILSKKKTVVLPSSFLKEKIAAILQEEGFLDGFSKSIEKQTALVLNLRYNQAQQSVISRVQRVSKPGQRKYVGKDEIPKVCSGMGISILSTSKGIMSDRQARKLGVGGELLCEVW